MLCHLTNGAKFLAPQAGIEPATKRLTVSCSTAELPGNKLGGGLGSRTLSPAFTDVRISNPLPYRPARPPAKLILYSQQRCLSTNIWLRV